MPERIRHTPPTELAELLPVRMCNELVYCERLFYLEHIQGYFVDSADTVEGRAQHERAARGVRRKKVAPPPPPDPDDDPAFAIAPGDSGPPGCHTLGRPMHDTSERAVLA